MREKHFALLLRKNTVRMLYQMSAGGFCENKCFVDSLKNYCEVNVLGRFMLCEGLVNSDNEVAVYAG